jgi:site-specific recombinase XerD
MEKTDQKAATRERKHMAVRKRGSVWYYDFMIRGVRYKKAVPEARTKAQAEQAESLARLEVFQGKYGRPAGRSVFIEFAEKVWLPWSGEHKRSHRDDTYFIEAFREFFGQKTFAEISPLLIEKYKSVRSKGISKRGTLRSQATVNRELSALSKIFEMALRERQAVENPVRLVKKFREDNERVRYLSPDEEQGLEDVLRFAPPYLQAFIVLTRHTGMRSGETLNLKIEQINLQDRTILLTRTKSGKSRRIPLNEIACEIVSQLIAEAEEKETEYLFLNPKTGRPYRYLRRSFLTLMKQAGVTDFSRHDLRHDAATNLVEAGASLIEVRDILGHSDIRMTQRYAHAKDQGVHQAVARLVERTKRFVPDLSHRVGGSLTAPVLPHHRTCGSASGGSV